MADINKDLDLFFERQEEIKKHAVEQNKIAEKKTTNFINDKVVPAFEVIRSELSKRGENCRVEHVNAGA